MPLIHPPHDPRRTDSRLYKGGDGGAGQLRADEQERQRKVQAAVDAINSKFGVAPSSGAMEVVLGAAPTREQFTTAATEGRYDMQGENGPTVYTPGTPGGFDDAAFSKAMADHEARKAQIYGTGDPAASAAQTKATRESLYTDISNAVRDTAMRDLDRQYTTASRRNKFGLARSGLLGGSADVESGGELQTLYGEGKLKATQAGQQAGSDMRVTDEKTRQNLIQLAQSGLDTGTASGLAAGQMAAAADSAKAAAAGTSIGRLFDDLSQAYVVNQVAKARNTAAQPTQAGYSGFGANRYTGTIQK
jgi:hypothetical protein